VILKFTEDLSSQEIYANGNELAGIMGLDKDAEGRRVHTRPRSESVHVATIPHPVLITDAWRIAQLGADGGVQRDTVFALYGTRFRTTVYGETALEFEQGRFPGVWGPSIDTLLVCRAMKPTVFGSVETLVEIGAGSGFISKHALRVLPGIQRATMVDMNPLAIECCREAVEDPRAAFVAGDGMAFLGEASADLVVCNPPYIPRPKSIDDNPYEGVQLLVDLIERAEQYLRPGGCLLLNLSSLCMDTARHAAARAGVTMEVLETMEVPLKVFNVLNNDDWREYLIHQKGLTDAPRGGYAHWHTLSVVAIRRPTSA
jgi:precorrin-6B methylase 2